MLFLTLIYRGGNFSDIIWLKSDLKNMHITLTDVVLNSFYRGGNFSDIFYG